MHIACTRIVFFSLTPETERVHVSSPRVNRGGDLISHLKQHKQNRHYVLFRLRERIFYSAASSISSWNRERLMSQFAMIYLQIMLTSHKCACVCYCKWLFFCISLSGIFALLWNYLLLLLLPVVLILTLHVLLCGCAFCHIWHFII